MTEDLHSPRLVSFGVYEVDLQAGELRKAGMKLKLTGQPFQLLAILLEHAGDVVTRKELQKELWPDTFVDIDRSLNAAINKIREALGDSAENPHFVETMPRRGYRFIGQINGQRRRTKGISERLNWLKIAGWIVAGLACAVAAVFFYRGLRDAKKPEGMTPIPFTSYPGLEVCPTFSPDGSQIAFAWNGGSDPAAKTFDLYVKVVDSENPLRLTYHPSEFVCPAWSPDGKQIAFHRLAGVDSGLYVVSALGGPERKLKSTHIPFGVSVPISWSPDGKWIAYVESLPPAGDQRVFLLSVETLQSMQIPHAPRCLHEGVPAFSHSGKDLAYGCMHGSREYAIYSVATSGGSPKLIVVFPDIGSAIAWTTDDDRIVFSQEVPVDELYEVVVATGSLRQIPFLHDGSWPAISPKREMLAYSVSSDNVNIWRRDLAHPEAPAVKLISSTRGQGAAQYSPDGKRIAFQSSRAGANDVWISDADGGNLVRVSKFDDAGGSPRWSPDGSKIAFDLRRPGHGEVYIADLADLVPRRLNTDKSNISLPSWSHDGEWIYFISDELTGQRVYRCPATGGNATALSALDAARAEESFDGKALYFIPRAVNAGLKSVSTERPGTESVLEGMLPVRLFSLWTMAPGGIYFVPADSPRSLCYLDFATRKIRHIFEIQKDFNHGLSVSPDGRWVLYSQLDEVNSDIMLVHHFK